MNGAAGPHENLSETVRLDFEVVRLYADIPGEVTGGARVELADALSGARIMDEVEDGLDDIEEG